MEVPINTHRLLLHWLGFALASGATIGAAEPSAFPTDQWQNATPESQGVDSSQLTEAIEQLSRSVGTDDSRELVIIRHGRIIWKGDDIDKQHGIWSATKSFTSTVLGLLIEDGKCTLDTRVADVLPEIERLRRMSARSSL